MKSSDEIQTFNSILASIKQGQIQPMYLLVSEEEYFKQELITCLEAHAIDISLKAFNLDLFYGTEATENQVLNACVSLPMMSERRLVIVHDIDKLVISDPDAFIRYFNTPEQSTTVLFLAEKLDTRKKLFSTLQKQSVSLKINPIKNDAFVLNWIKQQIESYNFTIDRDAIHLLHEHIGDNLFEITNQIKKICVFKGKDTHITVSDIEEMTGISKEYSVFQMINYLLERNAQKTLRVLKIILEQEQEPIALIAAIYSRILKQWQYNQLISEHNDEKVIAQKLKTKPFFLKDYRRVARTFNSVQLQDAIETLFRADYTLKSSGRNPKHTIEFAVHAILNPA